MKLKVIINPAAGRRITQNNVQKVIGRLQHESVVTQCDYFYTGKKRDACVEAGKLKKGDYDLIIAVGGDGTVHEVVNGIITSGSEIPLAIMPAGTVNDFGYFLHIPANAARYCQMIKDFNIKRIDVGKVNDEYFLNVFAFGKLIDVPHKVSQEHKNIFGKLAYYATGTIEFPLNIFKSNLLELEYDDKCVVEDTFLLIVSNSSSVGGFRKLAPIASIEDGLLDVCVMRKMSWEVLLPLVISFMKGEYVDSAHVSYFQTNKITVRAFDVLEDQTYDMDGELAGMLPASIEVCPKALNMLCPKRFESIINFKEINSCVE